MSVLPERIELDLPFRGERNYIQGADIYQAVVDAASPRVSRRAGPLSIRMHSLAHRQCDLLLGPPAAFAAKPALGRAEFRLEHWHGWLVETDRAVTRRLDYDEDEIIRRCRESGSIIHIAEPTTHSTIEAMIAACKKLHQTLYPLPGQKWIVSRLELERIIDWTDSGMEIELLQNLGNRLTRSALRTGTENVGHIYFSAIRS